MRGIGEECQQWVSCIHAAPASRQPNSALGRAALDSSSGEFALSSSSMLPLRPVRLFFPLLGIMVGGILCCHAIAAGAAIECRWAESRPVIDGRGDEATWTRATVVENFRQAWVAGEPAARQRTRVRL